MAPGPTGQRCSTTPTESCYSSRRAPGGRIADPRRQAPFDRLAARGGGLVVLHWGMGTKAAEPIEPFLKLFGGCHGGPDRKYQVLETELHVADPAHPVVAGSEELSRHATSSTTSSSSFLPRGGSRPAGASHDRRPQRNRGLGWERPDGGRSFGFTGLHFHDNWKLPQYRQLVTQAVRWTLSCRRCKPRPKASGPRHCAGRGQRLAVDQVARLRRDWPQAASIWSPFRSRTKTFDARGAQHFDKPLHARRRWACGRADLPPGCRGSRSTVPCDRPIRRRQPPCMFWPVVHAGQQHVLERQPPPGGFEVIRRPPCRISARPIFLLTRTSSFRRQSSGACSETARW